MTRLNILHLTDLHFRSDASQSSRDQRELVLNDLVDRFEQLVRVTGRESPHWMYDAEDWVPHIIAISGDIAFSGTSREYSEAKEFLDKLKAKIRALKPGQPLEVVACVGNHDRDITYASGLVYPKSNSEADDWLSLERLQPEAGNQSVSRAPLVVPFHNFQNFARTNDFLNPALKPGLDYLVGPVQSKAFPVVEFVVMNSAWFCNHLAKGDARNLWLGLPLLQRLEVRRRAESNAVKLRIALVHHPREWFHEEECNSYGDRPNAYRLLSKNCDVILSGHVHGSVEPASQSYGGAILFTGGATYEGVRWRNNFSVLQFDLDEGVVSRRAFEFDPRELRWQEVPHGNANEELRRGRRSVAPSRADQKPLISAVPPASPSSDSDSTSPDEKLLTSADLDSFPLRWKSVFWLEGETSGLRFTNIFRFTLKELQMVGQVEGESSAVDEGTMFSIEAEFQDGWITGVWRSEHSDRGRQRWGSLQLYAYRTTKGEIRMQGRWLGFNRNGRINVGQWRFRPWSGETLQ